MPADARVLDLGCWSGFNGRFLTANGRASRLIGVEIDHRAAARAQDLYSGVVVGDLEEPETLAAVAGTFDAVLMLDVLEHLSDPSPILKRALDWVSEAHGRIYVSLPNVAHWSVRWSLVRGRWNYTDHGILDRTHLRFFTWDTAEELLTSNGWRIVWRDLSEGDVPMLPAGPRLRRYLAGRRPRLFGVQFLFVAEPG